MIDYFKTQLEESAPVGVAAQKMGLGFDDYIERNRYHRKIKNTEFIIDDLKKEVAKKLEETDVPKDQTGKIIEDYLLNIEDEAFTKLEWDEKELKELKDNLKTAIQDYKKEALDKLFEEDAKRRIRGFSGLSEAQLDRVRAILDETEIAEIVYMRRQGTLERDTPLKEGKQLVGSQALRFGRNLVPDYTILKSLDATMKQNVTSGYGLPTFAYFLGNAMGAVQQTLIAQGSDAPSSLAFTVGENLTVWTQTVGHLYGGNIDAHFHTMSRYLFPQYEVIGKNQPVSPPSTKAKSSFLVCADGKIYTPLSLMFLAQKHGIGASYIQAELGRETSQKLRSHRIGVARGFFFDGIIRGQEYQEAATMIDNFFRVALFIQELKKGLSPEEAAKKVRDAYFDYSDLSAIEKNIFRYLNLFYSFARKNQVQLLKALVEEPDRVMSQLRLIRNSQKENLEDQDLISLPSYLQMRYFFTGGTPTYSKRAVELEYENTIGQYITVSPMFSVADAPIYLAPFYAALSPDASVGESLFQVGKHVITGGSPLIQATAETFRGKTFFMDRELEKIKYNSKEVEMLKMFGVKFKPVESETEDLTRIKDETEVMYRPLNKNQAKLANGYMILFKSIPYTAFVVGRGKEQANFILDRIESATTGEGMPTREGYTAAQEAAGVLGLKSYLIEVERLRRARLETEEAKKSEEILPKQ